MKPSGFYSRIFLFSSPSNSEQFQLAELIGTTTDNVRRWERGYTTPSPYFRERLCALFEKNAQELGLLLPHLAPEENTAREQQEREQTQASRSPGEQPFCEVEQEMVHRSYEQRVSSLPERGKRMLASLSYSV